MKRVFHLTVCDCHHRVTVGVPRYDESRYQGRFIGLLAYVWAPLGRFRRDFSGWGAGVVGEEGVATGKAVV